MILEIIERLGPIVAMVLVIIGSFGLGVFLTLWAVGFRVVGIKRERDEWESRTTETDPSRRRS